METHIVQDKRQPVAAARLDVVEELESLGVHLSYWQAKNDPSIERLYITDDDSERLGLYLEKDTSDGECCWSSPALDGKGSRSTKYDRANKDRAVISRFWTALAGRQWTDVVASVKGEPMQELSPLTQAALDTVARQASLEPEAYPSNVIEKARQRFVMHGGVQAEVLHWSNVGDQLGWRLKDGSSVLMYDFEIPVEVQDDKSE